MANKKQLIVLLPRKRSYVLLKVIWLYIYLEHTHVYMWMSFGNFLHNTPRIEEKVECFLLFTKWYTKVSTVHSCLCSRDPWVFFSLSPDLKGIQAWHKCLSFLQITETVFPFILHYWHTTNQTTHVWHAICPHDEFFFVLKEIVLGTHKSC